MKTTFTFQNKETINTKELELNQASKLIRQLHCKPIKLAVNCHNINQQLKNLLALTTACGGKIEITIEYTTIEIKPYSNINPLHYGKTGAGVNAYYKYLDEQMQGFKTTIQESSENYRADLAFNSKCEGLNLSDKAKDFIRVWAPAYGLPVPKMERTVTDSNMYLPATWKGFNRDDRCLDPYASKRKMERKEAETRNSVDSNNTIRSIFEQIKYYQKAGLELDPEYGICAHCGLPTRLMYPLEDEPQFAFFESNQAFQTVNVNILDKGFCKYCENELTREELLGSEQLSKEQWS